MTIILAMRNIIIAKMAQRDTLETSVCYQECYFASRILATSKLRGNGTIYIPRGQAEVPSFTRPFLAFVLGGAGPRD